MLATNRDFYNRCSNCRKWRKVSASNCLCDSCEYIRQTAPNLVTLAERKPEPNSQNRIRPVPPSKKKSTRVSAISKILDLLATGPKTASQIIQALGDQNIQATTVTSALWRALHAGKLVKQEFDRKGISSLWGLPDDREFVKSALEPPHPTELAILEFLQEGRKTFREICNHLKENLGRTSRSNAWARIDRLKRTGKIRRDRKKGGYYLVEGE